MLEMVSSEMSIQSWDVATNDLGDNLTNKVNALVQDILPQMLNANVFDADRIARALSYLALKIEDVQLLEKFAFAYKRKNLHEIKALLDEIKQRPESFILCEAIQGYFESAIRDNQDAIVDMIWETMGDSLNLENAFDALESAVNNHNKQRTKWLLDHFDIDTRYNIPDLFCVAIENDMFFVVETITSQYEDEIDFSSMSWMFEKFLESEEGHVLEALQYLWPKVKDEISEFSLRNKLNIAKENNNQRMVDFLNTCLKEKIN